MNSRQRRFCKEYLLDLNASAAAIRAGYSPKSASKQGYKLLHKNAEVRNAIRDGQARRSAQTEIDADRVLVELGKIGFANVTDFLSFGSHGVELIGSDDLTAEQTACINEVIGETFTTDNGETVGKFRLKLNDKLKALELIGKHCGMFHERIDLGGQADNPIHYEGSGIADDAISALLTAHMKRVAGK